ncbi:MAG TPA: OstA-like protein, partial [Flavobacterium sp.]
MKKTLFFNFIILVFCAFTPLLAQAPKKIIVEYSDYFDINQTEIPDAALLTGNVRVSHDGVVMTCNKAYYFQKENYIKA